MKDLLTGNPGNIHSGNKRFGHGFYLALVLVGIFLTTLEINLQAGPCKSKVGDKNLISGQIKTLLLHIKEEAESLIIAENGEPALNLLQVKFGQKYPVSKYPFTSGNSNCPEFLYVPGDDDKRRVEKIISQNGAYYVTGIEALFMGQNSIAKWCFANAAILSPSCPVLLSNLGFILNQEKDFNNAKTILEYAVSLDPNTGPAWANLGYCCKGSGLYNEAIYAYRKAWQLNPETVVYAEILLSLYMETGQYESTDSIRLQLALSYTNDPALTDYLYDKKDTVLSAILDEISRLARDYAPNMSEKSDFSDALSMMEEEKKRELDEHLEDYPGIDPLTSNKNEQNEEGIKNNEPALYDFSKNKDKLNNEDSKFTDRPIEDYEYWCNEFEPYGIMYKECMTNSDLKELWKKKIKLPEFGQWIICFMYFCIGSDFCYDYDVDQPCPYCEACQIGENEVKGLLDLYKIAVDGKQPKEKTAKKDKESGTTIAEGYYLGPLSLELDNEGNYTFGISVGIVSSEYKYNPTSNNLGAKLSVGPSYKFGLGSVKLLEAKGAAFVESDLEKGLNYGLEGEAVAAIPLEKGPGVKLNIPISLKNIFFENSENKP